MWLLYASSFLICVFAVQGDNCQSVAGKWYNELGSELIISQHTENLITGEYRTAVERYNGSAGAIIPIVKGVTKLSASGSLLSFVVTHNGGLSTTAWIGECVVCEGDEALLTTWLLRKFVMDSRDRWQSTMIGQNTFTRYDRVKGPRSEGATTPRRSARQIFLGETRSNEVHERFKETGNSIDGKWFSFNGAELDLIASTEQLKGNYSEQKTPIYGPATHPYSRATLGFTNLNAEAEEIQVWVGQPLLRDDGEQVLDSSFLQISSVKSKNQLKNSVVFGTEVFTRNKNSGGFTKKHEVSFFEKMKTSVTNFFKSLF